MDSIVSAYDSHRLGLVANGYHPHPIGPGSKKPMVVVDGEYREMVQWQSPARALAPSPQPGAGVGVRLGRQRDGYYLIALDWDDDKLSQIAMGRLPSPVCKAGQRGHTAFFVAHAEIPSKDFRVGHKCVVQVLSGGRQTVIPPSTHPDTGEPYFWLDDYSLMNTSLERLPELPADYIERIKGIIADSNMKLDPEEEPKAPSDGGDEDGPFAALNNAALKNLAAWVPDLNLYKCRRKVGRFPSYEAVATWRPSSTGRPDEERKLNLQISGARGIMDFGVMKGYSPINLVMAARACDRSAAYDWLSERVMPKPDIEIDFDKIKENASPSIEPDDGGGDNPDATKAPPEDEDALAALTGDFWEHGDPLPEQIPMLIPYFLPMVGVGYVGGEWGTFKTFILNDMAVGVAGAGMFAGQRVAEHGCVIQVELEGSQNEVRLTGASSARGVKEKLPIRVFTKAPPKILGPNKRVTPEWKKYCRGMKIQADRMKAKFGAPVRLFTIDPVTTIAGWADENSAAEGQAVYEGLLYLSQLLECVVVAADHYGKAAGSGLRGTVVKETAALFILGTSPRDKDMAARRFLEIRKMKNGRQNIAMDFFMDDHSFTAFRKVEKDGVETLEHMDVKTLAIRWDGELHPTDEKTEADGPTPQQHKMLNALKDLMQAKGIERSGALNDRVVSSKDWEDKCLADKICASKAVFKNQKSAMNGKFIGVSGDSVWFIAG